MDALAAVEVSLPPALTALFPGCPSQVRVSAATVAEAIAALNRSWPGLRERLCDDRPSLRRHLRVFVAGEIAVLETPLAAGDEVFVVTAISGG